MLKRIKHLLTHNSIYFAIIVTIGIAVLSLIKINYKPTVEVKHIDKLQHCLAYFTLTFFWILSFRKNKKSRIIVVILCVIYGIILEILQGTLTNYRTADYLDFIANTIGVLIALLAFNYFFKNN